MSTTTIEMKVDVSELKGDEAKLIEKLQDFLKEKTGGETTTEAKILTVKGEGEALSKKYIRVTLKKFLHKHEIDDYYRVISGKEEGTLRIKQRRLEEEE